MKIAITGSTGLVGTAVVDFFKKEGHHISRLVRPSTSLAENNGAAVIRWNFNSQEIEKDQLEGHDAVIHFAGENIASHRWSQNFKQKITTSRVASTRFLTQTLVGLKNPPKVFISASAVGYYGQLPPEQMADENSPKGNDFLADLCDQWEKETVPATEKGIRVVNIRLGMVLSRNGGALTKMLPVFKLGVGGRIGSGRQIMSWIPLEEIPPIIDFLINNETISGAVNAVAPYPVSNIVFTNILSKTLRRPAVVPLPEFMVKFIFGEMGETLLLSGANVQPKKLKQSGYRFRYPTIESALRASLNP